MSANKKRVSVVLAARNAGAIVAHSLRSVCDALGPNDEVIAIDDGSSDDTSRIMVETLSAVSFQLLRTTGTGLTRALNAGVLAATGRYVARLDAGDTMAADRLDVQVAEFASDPRLVVCGGNVRLVDEEYRRIAETAYPESDLGIRACLLAMTSPLVHSSLMMPRQTLIEAGNYRPYFTYAQDYDLVLRMSKLGRLKIVSEIVGEYVVSTTGISATRGAQQRRFAKLALAEHLAGRLRLPHRLPSSPGAPDRWEEARIRLRQVLRQGTARHRFAGDPMRALLFQATGWCLDPIGSAVGATVHVLERITGTRRKISRVPPSPSRGTRNGSC